MPQQVGPAGPGVPAGHVPDHVPAAHVPVLPARTGPAPARPDPALLAALRGRPTSDVADLVGRLYTMAPRIRPLYVPVPTVVGVARTAKAVPGDNLAVHRALARVQPGDVLVVDWQGYADGCGSGALSLVEPARRGLAAVVVDGGWRDVAELQQAGMPVFGRAEALFSPAKHEPGEVDVPVSCGGVVVEPGDVVVADAAGVVVVPRWAAGEVAAALGAAP